MFNFCTFQSNVLPSMYSTMIGKAVTYFTQKDMDFVRPIATVIHQAGFAVPEYLLHLKKVSKSVFVTLNLLILSIFIVDI